MGKAHIILAVTLILGFSQVCQCRPSTATSNLSFLKFGLNDRQSITLARADPGAATATIPMTLILSDSPSRTISISLDDDLLERLNDVCRLSLELGSRSQLVRELLELGLDLLERPADVLPMLVEGLRGNQKLLAEAYALAEQIRLDSVCHLVGRGTA